MELSINLNWILTELHVEVLTVWASAHGSTEDWLDHEAVVWLEGGAIGLAERCRELLGWVRNVLCEGDGGKFKTTVSKKEMLVRVSSESAGRGERIGEQTEQARRDPRWQCGSWWPIRS